MVTKHLFIPFTCYIRGGGKKNKWTNKPSGNNSESARFCEFKTFRDCGPHNLHTQLHAAPGLIIII